MHTFFLKPFVVVVAILVSVGVASADTPQRAFIVVSQDHSLVDDCEHFHTQNTTTFPAEAHSQEQKSFVAGRTMRVRASQAGGISIKGWDRPDAMLTVCKVAVGISHPQVERMLAGISVASANGEVIPAGPAINATQIWWVHLILNVPRNTRLDLGSENGGIAVRNMGGAVVAQAKNGAISLAQCNGEHRVETTNGGISLDKVTGRTNAKSSGGGISLAGGSGPVTLATETGEISIRLGSDAWQGGMLDARTDGGDLTLRIHEDYPARIEAQTTTDPGQILCRLKACEDVIRTATNHKRLVLGKTEPMIRLSTNNSPITIEEVR